MTPVQPTTQPLRLFRDLGEPQANAQKRAVSPELRLWSWFLRGQFHILRHAPWDEALDTLDWIAAGGRMVGPPGTTIADLVGVPHEDIEIAAVRILRERKARERSNSEGKQ